MKTLAALLIALLFTVPTASTAAPLTVEQTLNSPAAHVEASLAESHPSMLYAYAKRLFEAGQKDDAVFWFYAGQLRYRYLLIADPSLSADGAPALFASLNASIGQRINAWAGGAPKAWAAAMDRALVWDAAHPNPTTPKDANAWALEKARTGSAALRDDVLSNEVQIRANRKREGLELR